MRIDKDRHDSQFGTKVWPRVTKEIVKISPDFLLRHFLCKEGFEVLDILSANWTNDNKVIGLEKHNMATTSDTPKTQKSHKSKDKDSAKKSSKKRTHEEQAAAAAAVAAVDSQTSPSSKRQRTAEPTAAAEDEENMDTTAAPTVSGQYIPTEAELETNSPFVQQTTSFYLPLAPVAHRFPLAGLCAEHLSPLLLTYYPPLNGLVLSYANPRLSSTPSDPGIQSPSSTSKDTPLAMAKSIDEYAPSYVWLTADFTLLRPTAGSCLEGTVSLQNESYLGLTVYNFFNAGIPRARLPGDWSWVGESASTSTSTAAGNLQKDWMRGGKAAGAAADGWFVDGAGKRVDGLLRFTVRDFESAPSSERERGFLSIEGTLLDKAEDAKVDKEEREKGRAKGKGRRLGGAVGAGRR